MPILTIPKTYANNSVLNESDLDNIKNAIETFLNTTKLDGTNIQISAIADSVGSSMTSTGANAVAATMTSTGAASVFAAISTTEGYRLQGNSSGLGAFAAPNYVLATTESNLVTGSASSYTDVTNATVTITARNRPILLTLQSTSVSTTATEGTIQVNSGGASNLLVLRDATTVEKQGFIAESGVTRTYPCGTLQVVDLTPGTGSKVYKLQYAAASGTLSLTKVKLLAIEL